MDDTHIPQEPHTQENAVHGQGQRLPYRRTVPHVTQSPIVDESLRSTGRENETLPPTAQASIPSQPGRKHMGVATADPQYLPQNGPAHPRRSNPADPNYRQQLHYERYLQTPGSKKSIFVARQERARRHTLIAVIIVVVLFALVMWLLFFR